MIALFTGLAIAGPVLYLAVNAKLAVACALVALLVGFAMAGDYLTQRHAATDSGSVR